MSSQFIQIREEPSRTEIAKDILCAMLSDDSRPRMDVAVACEKAVWYADALIAELEKKKP